MLTWALSKEWLAIEHRGVFDREMAGIDDSKPTPGHSDSAAYLFLLDCQYKYFLSLVTLTSCKWNVSKNRAKLLGKALEAKRKNCLTGNGILVAMTSSSP